MALESAHEEDLISQQADVVRVLDALDEALDRPAEGRAAWLEERYSNDLALLAAVNRLLEADAAAAAVLPTRSPAIHAAEDVLPPPERIGAYRLTGLIGQGGMGAVYRGERADGLFQHTVAIKLISAGRLDSRAMERFAIERQALARLSHPNIARLLDGGVTAEGLSYIIMECVDGDPIGELVTAENLPDDAVVDLLLQVCRAVAAAHGRLVVHGDIKPSNILVTRAEADGRREARLLDFGVARLLDATDGGEGGQDSPVTAAYADPARALGEPPTAADDIFALGVVLRELISRGGPSLGSERPARALPPDLEAIATRASAADPHARYASADALAADLARWRRREPVTPRHGGPLYIGHRFVARRPRFTAALAAVALGLVATTAVTSILYLRAETARREADRRFGQAQAMARYMLFDLFEALNRTPGTVAIRRDLVDTSRTYLRDLASSPRASTTLKADAAMGYLRLAGVLGLYSSGSLGERDQARAMLGKAAALLASPPADATTSAAWTHAVGRLHLYQGFDTLNQGAGPAAAEPKLKAAEAELRRAAALAPRDAEILADLWECRLSEADLQSTRNNYKAAEAILKTELAAYPARLPVLAAHDKTPLLLARTLKYLGDARYYQDDKPGSIRPFTAAVQVLEAENRRRPDRSRTVVELMDGWWNLAESLQEVKGGRAGLDLLDKAVALGRARMLVDPENDLLRRMTNLATLDRASLLGRLGRKAEALADARAMLAERKASADAHPGDIVRVRSYLTSLRPFADVEKAVGLKAQACADYRSTLQQWTGFETRYGVAPKMREIEIKPLQEQVAKCR